LTRARVRWGRAGALLLLALALAGCAPKVAPTVWQRPDVSEDTARGVEQNCRQHAILDIARANGPADAQVVHGERDAYVERCMLASGFTRR
jgi:hypothetical protein